MLPCAELIEPHSLNAHATYMGRTNDEQTREDTSQPMDAGWLSFAIICVKLH